MEEQVAVKDELTEVFDVEFQLREAVSDSLERLFDRFLNLDHSPFSDTSFGTRSGDGSRGERGEVRELVRGGSDVLDRRERLEVVVVERAHEGVGTV